MKPFKLGIIGGGLESIAGYPHIAGSQLDGRWKVEAGVFSRDEQKNAAAAEYWNVPRRYDTFQELVKGELGRLDAVAVLLPTPEHHSAVEMLLRAGLPVICEKPLFSSLDQYSALENIGNLENIQKHFLAVTYNYNAYPMLEELRRRLQKRDLGRVLDIHLEMPQESFLRPLKEGYPPAWRKQDGEIPGIILDLLSHLFSLATYLGMPKVSSVYSTFKSSSRFRVVDDVKVLLEYEQGATGTMWVSKTALGHRNGLKLSIYGTAGAATWIQAEPELLRMSYQNGSKLILDRGNSPAVADVPRFNRMRPGHPAGFIEAFGNLYYELADALAKFKAGKAYNTHPLIWSYQQERELCHMLDLVVQSATQCCSLKLRNTFPQERI